MTRLRWTGAAIGTVAALVLAVPLLAGTEAIPGGNLVQNPGAEASPGVATDTVTPIAGWTTTGAMTAWTYGALGDRPDKAFAASIGGGTSFFSGGPGGVAGTPTASQAIDVSAAAVEIDAGGVAATLRAFIGGYTVSEDLLRIDAAFLDGSGARLGGIRIGPVNREDRKRLTTLLERSTTGNLPKGTRRIDVVISVAVDNNGKNQAYADNISLTLGKASKAPATGKATLSVACSGKTLVASVRPAKGSAVRSVTFLVNGKPVAIDKKAPFTARIGTRGLPASLKVAARVKRAGKTVTLTKSTARC
jgi:hypothetical protein